MMEIKARHTQGLILDLELEAGVIWNGVIGFDSLGPFLVIPFISTIVNGLDHLSSSRRDGAFPRCCISNLPWLDRPKLTLAFELSRFKFVWNRYLSLVGVLQGPLWPRFYPSLWAYLAQHRALIVASSSGEWLPKIGAVKPTQSSNFLFVRSWCWDDKFDCASELAHHNAGTLVP